MTVHDTTCALAPPHRHHLRYRCTASSSSKPIATACLSSQIRSNRRFICALQSPLYLPTYGVFDSFNMYLSFNAIVDLIGGQGRRFGDGVFGTTGFRNWKKACEKIKEHVGTHGSVYNDARALLFVFKDQRQSSTRKVVVGKEVLGEAYHIRLTASLDATRYLLRQGMDFRGHDETKISLNRGNRTKSQSLKGSNGESAEKSSTYMS
ncbi:hypothetical protein V2J09_000469 [Rumex salicifolius]